MKTGKTVVDEKRLTDAEIGQIYRKTSEIIRRINDGTIDLKKSIGVMQKIIIEGHANEHLQVVNGLAGINIFEHIIDTNAVPFTPSNFSVERHIGHGPWEWSLDLIGLFRSKEQENNYQNGNSLEKVIEALKGKKILNANVLDYLLDHPGLIPESWKGKFIFFWGTIYLHSNGYRNIRFLYWNGSMWDWDVHSLDYDFDFKSPAVFAS